FYDRRTFAFIKPLDDPKRSVFFCPSYAMDQACLQNGKLVLYNIATDSKWREYAVDVRLATLEDVSHTRQVGWIRDFDATLNIGHLTDRGGLWWKFTDRDIVCESL